MNKFHRHPFLIFLAVFLLRSISFAGGSIDWTEVLSQIKKDDAFLAAFISSHFDVVRVGGAVRVGHDKNGNSMVEGAEVGTRMPPYKFYAKVKDEKGDYNLLLTITPVEDSSSKENLWQVIIRKKQPND